MLSRYKSRSRYGNVAKSRPKENNQNGRRNALKIKSNDLMRKAIPRSQGDGWRQQGEYREPIPHTNIKYHPDKTQPHNRTLPRVMPQSQSQSQSSKSYKLSSTQQPPYHPTTKYGNIPSYHSSRSGAPSRHAIPPSVSKPHHSTHQTTYHAKTTTPSHSTRKTISSNLSQSSRSTHSKYPSMNAEQKHSTHSGKTSSGSGKIPSGSLPVYEKPHTQVQHEVNQSTAPNLNLSTYGYSVNARDTTRQKALHDAVDREGVDAVRNRMSFLISKYDSQPAVVKILYDDYEWMERYHSTNETRQRFDSQREQTRQKIYQRMQEKSKSRHHTRTR